MKQSGMEKRIEDPRMSAEPAFDVASAHRYFAVHCFNAAWGLIDKPSRTPEEDRQMVALNQASIYHWQSRPDCTRQNLSIGYWQASRIHAVLANPGEAQRSAEICLEYSEGLEPFFIGYAYEALARAALLAGDRAKSAEHASRARAQAERVEDAEDRDLLVKDLSSLQA